MRDFFDEDFPLSAKQEEEYKKQQEELEAQKSLQEALAEQENADSSEAADDKYDEPIDEAFTISPEVEFAESEEPCEVYYAGMSETEEVFEALKQEDEPTEVGPAVSEDAPCDEIVEHDPIDEAPIFDLELDEPLDDGFIPDAPIITPVSEELDKLIPIEEDDELSEELKSLTEKLDSMEKAVDAMNAPADEADEEETDADFTYEYDSRYFAEEETTAYKHPELVKKTSVSSPKAKKKSKKELTINLKTLAKVGAAIAGVVVAAKLLSDDSKK